MKLRNKTFDWTSKVRNLLKLNLFLSRDLRLKKNIGSFGTVGETQKPYETDEKMEMAKQDTTKTSFLTLSNSKISIVVTDIVPKTGEDYDVND